MLIKIFFNDLGLSIFPSQEFLIRSAPLYVEMSESETHDIGRLVCVCERGWVFEGGLRIGDQILHDIIYEYKEKIFKFFCRTGRLC